MNTEDFGYLYGEPPTFVFGCQMVWISDGFESGLELDLFCRTQNQVLKSRTLPILLMGLSPDSDSLKGLGLKSTKSGLNPSPVWILNDPLSHLTSLDRISATH